MASRTAKRRAARERLTSSTSFRWAGAPEPPAPVPLTSRFPVKLGLLVLGAVLLSLSFAPYKQFYLAPFGLVPWLAVLGRCRSQWRAFGWSWVAGALFFAGNMWWLLYVTVPGTLALVVILALYPATAGWLIRGLGLLRGPEPGGGFVGTGDVSPDATHVVSDGNDGANGANRANGAAVSRAARLSGWRPLLAVFGIAVVWVTVAEWLRGTWPFQGLPWLYLGYTQTPALYGCQIADVTGVYGVSFWVVLVNAWVALFFLNRLNARGLRTAGVAVLAVLVGVFGYGVFRFSQKATYPGPTVLVVQSNYPQSNTGEKGAPPAERVNFHEHATLRQLEAPNAHVDLVVWSETMMPPVNPEARATFRGELFGDAAGPVDLDQVNANLKNLVYHYDTALLIGMEYAGDFQVHTDAKGRQFVFPADTRNSAVYFPHTGTPPSDTQYDKIHRVPFGEYIPFKESLPWLYRLLISLGPPDMEDYQLRQGDASRPVVFPLPQPGQPLDQPAGGAGGPGRPWRFVTPICFEDIDASLVAWMFRAQGSGARSAPKEADFIVNLTNDGWFKANEMPQHLQAAAFRSIENRAPTARSVNTGVSGFIDSFGREGGLVRAGTEGSSVATLQLDRRTTFYTHWGDVFALACAAAAGVMSAAGSVRWWLRRRSRRRAAGTAPTTEAPRGG